MSTSVKQPTVKKNSPFDTVPSIFGILGIIGIVFNSWFPPNASSGDIGQAGLWFILLGFAGCTAAASSSISRADKKNITLLQVINLLWLILVVIIVIIVAAGIGSSKLF